MKRVVLCVVGVSSIFVALALTSCSNGGGSDSTEVRSTRVSTPTTTPSDATGLGISLSEIQTEFSSFDFYPDEIPLRVAFRLSLVYDFERQQPVVAASKLPGIAFSIGESVDLLLIGPEDDLTSAIVLFERTIDGFDAIDVGWFIHLVAPDVHGVDWALTGYRSGWYWDGFWDLEGYKGDVHIRVTRKGGFIAVIVHAIASPKSTSRMVPPMNNLMERRRYDGIYQSMGGEQHA